jgi:hypothetical protein
MLASVVGYAPILAQKVGEIWALLMAARSFSCYYERLALLLGPGYDTLGMRYIGGKAGLLDKLKATVESQCGNTAKGAGNKFFAIYFPARVLLRNFSRMTTRLSQTICFTFPTS